MAIHSPVLVKEVAKYLKVREGGTYIDATTNGGGHAQEILRLSGSHGKVLGIEWDRELALMMKKNASKNLIIVRENYKNMSTIVRKKRLGAIDGILFDFGMSSWHLDVSGRGFSFQKDEPLDMRFSIENERVTAADFVNTLSAKTLADIFSTFGGERYARRIADAIVTARKTARITSTAQLSELIKKSIPKKFSGRIHPSTKVFQALRIAVNEELQNIRDGLTAACSLVRTGGRVVAISFHSLEDRIVKDMFRSQGGLVLTKKSIQADREEMIRNPRARSARLRAWEKTI